MVFDIMTLFPELVNYVLGESIIGRAQKSGAITVKNHINDLNLTIRESILQIFLR